MPDLITALRYFNDNIGKLWYGWIDSADGEVYSNLQLLNDDATMLNRGTSKCKVVELQDNLYY